MKKSINNIYYFGFGANKSPEMMAAIIGRKPSGRPVFIDNFELCIEYMDEINRRARGRLSSFWGNEFASYTIRQRLGKRVYGTVWEITEAERRLVKDWELCGVWSRAINVVAFDKTGSPYPCETEIVENYSIQKVENRRNYPVYVAPRGKMLYAARVDRLK